MASPILFSIVMAAAPATPPPTPSKAPQPPLQACYAWGPRPPQCIEPPLRERFKAYVFWRDGDDALERDSHIVRKASQISEYDTPLPKDAFPAFLRQGDARIEARVEMELVIGADGAVKSCTPGKVLAFLHTDDRKRTETAADPALGGKACDVVRATRKFRPAIDALGNPVESGIGFQAVYERERYDMLAPPAPPAPSRWIRRDSTNPRQSWVPYRYRYGSAPVRITAPDFRKFLTDKAKLPKEAVVGAVVDFAPDGQAVKCEVKLPGGDKRLDDATCAGLMTARNQPSAFPANTVPIEVTWRGAKAAALVGGDEIVPQLVAPVAIPATELPVADPPKWPITVRLALDGNGKALSCKVVWPSYNDRLDAASCRHARAMAVFKGAKDVFWHPIGSSIDLRADWKTGQIDFRGY
ncbi:MAG: hypothetical protein ACKOPQ_10195 [Novosphingobium sp.]